MRLWRCGTTVMVWGLCLVGNAHAQTSSRSGSNDLTFFQWVLIGGMCVCGLMAYKSHDLSKRLTAQNSLYGDVPLGDRAKAKFMKGFWIVLALLLGSVGAGTNK